MVIRRAKINESQKIRKFEDRAWHEKNVTSECDMANAVRFSYVFVAIERDKIVGLICAVRTRNDDVYVEEWCVDEKYRGKGIGKKLYIRLLKEVGNKKILAFTQLSNKISQKAHCRLGFKIVEKVEDAYNTGEPRLLLVRNKK